MNTLRRLAFLLGMAGIFLTLGPEEGGGVSVRRKGRRPRRNPAPISTPIPTPAPLPVGSITMIAEPKIRQVVQRRDDNFGNIVFMGRAGGHVDGFQARSVLRPGMPGRAQDWTPLDFISINGNQFIAIFRQAAGGFYDLQIRPTFQGQVGEASTVFAVGVGEVFITAGQSNATNFAKPTGFIPDLRISSFDDGPGRGIDPAYPDARWKWGIDPQPAIDLSSGGSAWPRMATNLAAALDVPIGLYSVGCGGTTIEQWLPGTVTGPNPVLPRVVLFDRLTNALNYFKFRGGVRAVLWDQGESDTAAGTDPSVYEARLREVIYLSRLVTGVPVKWMVAVATGPPNQDPEYQLELGQAQMDVADGWMTFIGPNTDLLGLSFRQAPPAGYTFHFNANGIQLLGDLWGIYVFHSPGFLSPGVLPIR